MSQMGLVPLNGLGMQVNPASGDPLPQNILAGMRKMATRNIMQNGLLHFDLSSSNQGNVEYTVTVANCRAHITMSDDVGLFSGLSNYENGTPRLAGKVRFTLHFDCDLLGNDGQSPSIQDVQLEQQLLPIEYGEVF